MTEAETRKARQTGLFHRVLSLANVAPDPGNPPLGRSGPLKVACLGNLDPRKGVLEFVDVVSAVSHTIPDVEAVIIGGPTGYLSVDDVKNRAINLGSHGRIEVTGWVSETTKNSLLSNADVFLYLSRHDLAPIALIEALSHGCAPIVLNIGGLAEMIGPKLADNVIDADELAEALDAARQRIVDYHVDRRSLGRDKARARQRYLEMFSPHRFRAGLLTFLNQPDDGQSNPHGTRRAALADQIS